MSHILCGTHASMNMLGLWRHHCGCLCSSRLREDHYGLGWCSDQILIYDIYSGEWFTWSRKVILVYTVLLISGVRDFVFKIYNLFDRNPLLSCSTFIEIRSITEYWFLLSSDIRSEESIAIVKNFDFEFLIVLDSITLSDLKKVF